MQLRHYSQTAVSSNKQSNAVSPEQSKKREQEIAQREQALQRMEEALRGETYRAKQRLEAVVEREREVQDEQAKLR